MQAFKDRVDSNLLKLCFWINTRDTVQQRKMFKKQQKKLKIQKNTLLHRVILICKHP